MPTPAHPKSNENRSLADLINDDANLAEIEQALAEVVTSGYGVVEIVVARGQVTGFRKTVDRKLGKFKSKAP